MRPESPSRSTARRGVRRARLFAPAILVLAPVLAACSSGDSSDEDTLVVYVGRDEALVAPLLEQFTEDTGIEIETRYAGTSDHLATLLEEGERTPADVFLSQDAGALGALSDAGLLQPLPAEVADRVAAPVTSADDTWVGVTGRARVIAYNTDAVSADEIPDNVAALTEDEWSGRVGIAPGNASFQAFVTAFRVAEGDDAARTWLEDLAANDVQTFEGNSDILQALRDGVLDVGLINHYYLYEAAAEVGADTIPVALEFPRAGDPGALVNVTGAAALSDHPDADDLLAYLVSDDAQRYFVENTSEYPLVEGIDPPEGLPTLSDIEGPIDDLALLADLEASLLMIEEAGLS